MRTSIGGKTWSLTFDPEELLIVYMRKGLNNESFKAMLFSRTARPVVLSTEHLTRHIPCDFDRSDALPGLFSFSLHTPGLTEEILVDALMDGNCGTLERLKYGDCLTDHVVIRDEMFDIIASEEDVDPNNPNKTRIVRSRMTASLAVVTTAGEWSSIFFIPELSWHKGIELKEIVDEAWGE